MKLNRELSPKTIKMLIICLIVVIALIVISYPFHYFGLLKSVGIGCAKLNEVVGSRRDDPPVCCYDMEPRKCYPGDPCMGGLAICSTKDENKLVDKAWEEYRKNPEVYKSQHPNFYDNFLIQ